MKYIINLFAIVCCLSAKGQDLCYTEQTGNSEKGFVGHINNKKIFYEIWCVPGAAGTNYNSLILRTDTNNFSDSIEFCIDEETGVVSKLQITTDSFFFDTVADIALLPTVFQVLIPVIYGYQNFNSFNSEGKNVIYIKDNRLYLNYTTNNRYDPPLIERFVYEFKGGKFEMLSKDTEFIED